VYHRLCCTSSLSMVLAGSDGGPARPLLCLALEPVPPCRTDNGQGTADGPDLVPSPSHSKTLIYQTKSIRFPHLSTGCGRPARPLAERPGGGAGFKPASVFPKPRAGCARSGISPECIDCGEPPLAGILGAAPRFFPGYITDGGC